MGATTISVFHHDRYRSCVVPAVRRLLRSGELGPWLQAVWDHLQNRHSATVGRPFAFEPNGNDEQVLDADLLVTAGPDGEWFYFPAKPTTERANVVALFQHAVEGCCVSGSVVVGRGIWPSQLLDEDDPPEPLYGLMKKLGQNATVWNTKIDVFREGVLGWLSPPETADAARLLSRFNLPDREPDPVLARTNVMEFHHQMVVRPLHHIRAVAQSAWEQGCGVLLGNDLEHQNRDYAPFAAPHPAFATETVQLLARTIRDRREFDVLPVLADALQEAGCENDVVLAHCRDVNEHADACWVADLILANGADAHTP